MSNDQPSAATVPATTERPLVVVSNRLPVHLHETDGVWTARASAGGLATALRGLAGQRTWIGWPGAEVAKEAEAGVRDLLAQVVPIDPQLRPILQELFDAAEPGTEAVVPRLRDPGVNLRTTFQKIIARAGVKPWPRLFHNMRASCATDWVERFPAHVVAGWLGHSPMIAAQHYLQTRDAHFDLAAGVGEAASNPATQARPSGPRGSGPKTQNPQKSSDCVGVGVPCDAVETGPMGSPGLEPGTPAFSMRCSTN